jgi:type VI protein secretion system component VasF
MTDAELRQLAQIELRLAAESPELRRLFDGPASPSRRRRRRAWSAAGVLTAVVALVLLGCGAGLGLPGLAVSALCPPLTFGVLLLGNLLAGRRAARHGSGRNR